MKKIWYLDILDKNGMYAVTQRKVNFSINFIWCYEKPLTYNKLFLLPSTCFFLKPLLTLLKIEIFSYSFEKSK